MEIKISKEMRELIEEIDISDNNYQKASDRYKSIAKYIEESELGGYGPDIYLQGSIKLGTAIKPISEEGSYDIDIVCNLKAKTRLSQSQSDLKNEVGEVVKRYALANNMKNFPSESNRCWTLNYVDESNFHIDILPAIPWGKYEDQNIAISDKRSDCYYRITDQWEISNPKGYAEWFRKQGEYKVLLERYAREFNCKIEEIPEYKVRTPLQRIVQIMKRHAEMMFRDDLEYKPSSIIITTLVAIEYPNAIVNSDDFESLICNIIKNFTNGIMRSREGKPYVCNPVNQSEKLSLKWDKDYDYFEAFITWVRQLEIDFDIDRREVPFIEKMDCISRSLLPNSTRGEKKLDYIIHHQKMKWQYLDNTLYNVEIMGTYHRKGFRSKTLRSGQGVYKAAILKFEVRCNRDINNFKIYWQVTNTGLEAEKANCLRGGFYESHIFKGQKVREECTKYLGKHYIEAYLIKDDICYGKSAPFEVNIINPNFHNKFIG